jgi:ABC-type transporter Mla subunit MlaD
VSEGGQGGLPGPADLAGQLRAAADRIMTGWTSMAGAAASAGETVAAPRLPTMPATVSAQQMDTFLDELAARRVQVQALITQLQSFDEQLGTLEANARPFVEWTRTSADLEKSMVSMWGPPSGASGQ